MAATTLEPTTDRGTGHGDLVAHIVRKDDYLRAAVYGEPITALCGKHWTPSCEPPEGTPKCEPCHLIFEAITGGK